MGDWTLSYDRDIAEIVNAEKLGYDEYWIGEHHFGGYENVPMPELMIAKTSAVTSRRPGRAARHGDRTARVELRRGVSARDARR